MLLAWSWVASAAPMGPVDEDLARVEPPTVGRSACDETYPFALQRLPESELYAPFRDDRIYGTPTMINLIGDAAARVAVEYPDAPPLLVGDISQRNGGAIPPHRTHGDGMSADIGLYGWTGTFDGLKGGFQKMPGKNLDVERTWAVIEAVLATGQVEHILLDQRHIDHIRGWLVETGRKTPAEVADLFPPLTTPRLWARTGYVRHAEAHADHLHVRVLCAEPGRVDRS